MVLVILEAPIVGGSEDVALNASFNCAARKFHAIGEQHPRP